MLINLTPHPITVHRVNAEWLPEEDRDITIEPSGQLARVQTIVEETGVDISGKIPVVRTSYGSIIGLPEHQSDGRVYIVSSVVLAALRATDPARYQKMDVVAPDTGPTCIRDANGQIVAITQFTV